MSDLKETAKKNLKIMKKSSTSHPMREESRIIKYGTIGFVRNIWLSIAATVVMTITLVILFVTIVAGGVLSNTADNIREKIDITIYLKPETPEKTLETLASIIAKDNNLKSVDYTTSEGEYEKFIEENSKDDVIINVVSDEEMRKLMISEMQATMRIKVYDIDNLDSIKELVSVNETFKENIDPIMRPTYDVNQIEIAKITKWAKIAKLGGIILGIIFLIISILIIFSTIRMAIFSRREEIYMMKLVGAGKRFIRGPFIIEAELCGVIAGVLASTLSFVLFEFLSPRLDNYGIDIELVTDIFRTNKIILVYGVFILIGIIIGRISARLAIKRYLNKA